MRPASDNPAIVEFNAKFLATFPGVVLYICCGEYHNDMDDDCYDSQTYGNIPASAPKGEKFEDVHLTQWVYEHILQEIDNYRDPAENQQELERICAQILDVCTNSKRINENLAQVLWGLASYFNDDGYYIVETEEQQYSRRINAQRASIEPLAAKIARKHSVTVGTLEFVTALHIEISQQETAEQSRKYGLREDGLCIGYGVSYDQWQEEYNSPLYGLCEAKVVLEWLEEFSPLLLCAWREKHPDGVSETEIWNHTT